MGAGGKLPAPGEARVEKLKHKLLALSLPRSGSRYLTTVLHAARVKVGHEMFKRDGTVGTFFAVEDVIYPGKHWSTDDESRQRRSDYEFERVWHYTRDPRKVIPSMASRFMAPAIWVWQERHTGISAGLWPAKLRAMKLWVAWNELIERNEKIDLFFRIEDIDARWDEMCESVGLPADTELHDVDRTYGTLEKGPRRTMPMTWDEMKSIDAEAARAVRDMARRYGYED